MSLRSMKVAALTVLLACAVVACGGDDAASDDGEGGSGGAGNGGGGNGASGATGSGASGGEPSGAGAAGSTSSGGGAGAGGPGPCPASMTCADTLPFHDERDTSTEGQSLIDAYGCQPATDESGPEIYYRVLVPGPGKLTATITDGTGVDIDVHILTSIKNGQCLVRDDITAVADVGPPYVYVSADTYVSDGVPQAGAFSIDIDFEPD